MITHSDDRKHCTRCGRVLNKAFYSEKHGPYGPTCLKKSILEMKNQEKIILELTETEIILKENWEHFKNHYGLVEVENEK